MSIIASETSRGQGTCSLFGSAEGWIIPLQKKARATKKRQQACCRLVPSAISRQLNSQLKLSFPYRFVFLDASLLMTVVCVPRKQSIRLSLSFFYGSKYLAVVFFYHYFLFVPVRFFFSGSFVTHFMESSGWRRFALLRCYLHTLLAIQSFFSHKVSLF